MRLEVNPNAGTAIELFGPTMEFMTLPEDEGNDMTKKLARFFLEVGRPVGDRPQSPRPKT